MADPSAPVGEPVDIAAEAIRKHSNGSAHSSASVAVAALRMAGYLVDPESLPVLLPGQHLPEGSRGTRVDEILSADELTALAEATETRPRRERGPR